MTIQFNAAFSLTPALSLRQRESFLPAPEKSLNGELDRRAQNVLPLLWAEGRGEGKGGGELIRYG